MEIKKILRPRSGKTAILTVALALLTLMTLFTEATAARDVILTIRQSGKVFEDAQRGLNDELASDLDVRDHVIDKKCTTGEIAGLIAQNKPRLVVLMDNSVIALFRKYQASLPAGTAPLPSVSIMGIMIRSAIADLKNAAGISYEVPVVTSLVSLRSVPITGARQHVIHGFSRIGCS